MYPAYENTMSISALVAPYTVASELPENAFSKLRVGFLTDVLPPRTTRPVIPMLKSSGYVKQSLSHVAYSKYSQDKSHEFDGTNNIRKDERPLRVKNHN